MALAEAPTGIVGRFFRGRVGLFGNRTRPASPDTEGVIRTGGVDIDIMPSGPQIRVRIVGDRDSMTGEMQDPLHGTTYFVPLAKGEETVIPLNST